jgi:hypothetical protein
MQGQTSRSPEAITADAGFYSEANLQKAEELGLNLYLPPERPGPRRRKRKVAHSRAQYAVKMRAKLQEPVGEAIYKLRQQIVEPVFGQIEAARGIRRFSFRGLARVAAEWAIITMTHNLLKLYRQARTHSPSRKAPKNVGKGSNLLQTLDFLRALSWVPSLMGS